MGTTYKIEYLFSFKVSSNLALSISIMILLLTDFTLQPIKSVNNLLEAIENSKDIPLASFIYALGISNVGIKTANDLANHFKSLDNIKNSIGYLNLFIDLKFWLACACAITIIINIKHIYNTFIQIGRAHV